MQLMVAASTHPSLIRSSRIHLDAPPYDRARSSSMLEGASLLAEYFSSMQVVIFVLCWVWIVSLPVLEIKVRGNGTL